MWSRQWLYRCVHGQVEAIQTASASSASWTGVALWDTSAHASLCSAPERPQQPAALRLGLSYGVQGAPTHNAAGREGSPGEVAVSDSVALRVCDPRCIPAVGIKAGCAQHTALPKIRFYMWVR